MNSVAQHIQKIHFALLASCVSLLLMLASNSNQSVRTAINQLDEIEKVCRNWDGFKLVEGIKKKVETRGFKTQNKVYRASIKIKQHNFDIVFNNPESDMLWWFSSPPVFQEWIKVHNESAESFKRLVKEFRLRHSKDIFFDEDDRDPIKSIFYDKIPENMRSPDNLFQFKNVWNLLNQDAHVTYARITGDEAYVNYFFRQRRFGPFKLTTSPVGEVKKTAKPACEITDFKMLDIDKSKVDKGNGLYYHASFSCDNEEWEALIPAVESHNTTIKGLESCLISDFNKHWKTGQFDDAFKELNENSLYLDKTDWVNIRHALNQKLTYSSEWIEMAGVKLPANNMIIFGIALVAIILLYLYFNIQHLTATLDNNLHTSIESTWIGLYPSNYPYITSLISIVALPNFLASTCAYTYMKLPKQSLTEVYIIAISSTVIVVNTILLFIQIRKLRCHAINTKVNTGTNHKSVR